ncbi:hypothetical protein ACP8Y2_13410 [Herpetosiphon llansteffanensis]
MSTNPFQLKCPNCQQIIKYKTWVMALNGILIVAFLGLIIYLIPQIIADPRGFRSTMRLMLLSSFVILLIFFGITYMADPFERS